MTDRELLELAAKAAGIVGIKHEHGLMIDFYGCGYKPWNPLTDDGDALRLAVNLRIQIEHCKTMGGEFVEVHAYPSGRGDCFGVEPFADDPYAATRRAIVRAAAEIGRSLSADR